MTRQVIGTVAIAIVGILNFVSYAPQIIKLLKTKKSDDIAMSSWIIWVISSICYLIYSITIAEIMLIIECSLEFSLNITVLILTKKYRGGNNNGAAV